MRTVRATCDRVHDAGQQLDQIIDVVNQPPGVICLRRVGRLLYEGEEQLLLVALALIHRCQNDLVGLLAAEAPT